MSPIEEAKALHDGGASKCQEIRYMKKAGSLLPVWLPVAIERALQCQGGDVLMMSVLGNTGDGG